MTFYICSLPNPGEPGAPHQLITEDPAELEAFAQREDKPGRGVYVCINPLVPGAKRRCLETVAELRFIYFDLDLQNIDASREEVIRRLRQLPFEFTWAHDSGSGNLHIGIEIKDPPLPGTAEYDHVVALWKRLVEKLAADPAPAHPAALIRALNTHNTKNGNSGLCVQLWNGGAPQDITELEAFDELLVEPLLTYKAKPRTRGDDSDDIEDGHKTPVDIDARLAAMRWRGEGDSAINVTQRDVMAALIAHSVSLNEATATILDATRQCVAGDPEAAKWDWRQEELDIAWSGARFINKNPEYANRLPDDLYAKFEELAKAGQRPTISKNRYRLFVRPARNTEEDEGGQNDNRKQKSQEPPPIRAIPFAAFDPAQLAAREWLYDGHYQRGVLTATIGTGGGGKSSLSLVELIAMCSARNLLGEQPLERCKAWYHNAEESLDEIYRRIAAICQHYKIEQSELVGWLFVTSGIEMPIKIATTKRSNLVIEETAARAIIRTIADNEIGVVCFDPLIAHHTGTENVTGDMDQVCREFARIANVTNCSTDLVHHTRKPAPGQEELSVTDSRGASAVKDAVRSMRVLNTMTRAEGEKLGIDDVDRRLHFRVDNGKANMTPPSAANWFKFVSVDIPNGDNVGVVTEWVYPADTVMEIPDAICTQIQTDVTKKEYRAATQSPDWIGYLVARVLKIDVSKKPGKAAVSRTLETLYNKNVITAADGETGRHKVKIVIPGPWRPHT